MTPSETTSEEKSSRSYWGFVLWPFVLLLLYALSSGPAVLAVDQGVVGPEVMTVYRPVVVLVHATRLTKPYRMYLQLFVPNLFDKDGN